MPWNWIRMILIIAEFELTVDLFCILTISGAIHELGELLSCFVLLLMIM